MSHEHYIRMSKIVSDDSNAYDDIHMQLLKFMQRISDDFHIKLCGDTYDKND